MEELKALLGEELYKQVTEKLGDKKVMIDDGNFIPKKRFDEVNEAKKELEQQNKNKDKQITDIQKKVTDNEELQKEITQMKEANKTAEKEWAKKLETMQLDHALESSFKDAKAKNNVAVKALLDMEKVKLVDGKVFGLDEQIEVLKKEHAYMFDVEEAPAGTGGNPTNFNGGGAGSLGDPTANDFVNNFSFIPKQDA